MVKISFEILKTNIILNVFLDWKKTQRIHRTLNKVQAGTLGDKWPPDLSLTLRFSVNTAEIIFIVIRGLGNKRKSWGLQKARNQMWDTSIKLGPHPRCKVNKRNNLIGKKGDSKKNLHTCLVLGARPCRKGSSENVWPQTEHHMDWQSFLKRKMRADGVI